MLMVLVSVVGVRGVRAGERKEPHTTYKVYEDTQQHTRHHYLARKDMTLVPVHLVVP